MVSMYSIFGRPYLYADLSESPSAASINNPSQVGDQPRLCTLVLAFTSKVEDPAGFSIVRSYSIYFRSWYPVEDPVRFSIVRSYSIFFKSGYPVEDPARFSIVRSDSISI